MKKPASLRSRQDVGFDCGNSPVEFRVKQFTENAGNSQASLPCCGTTDFLVNEQHIGLRWRMKSIPLQSFPCPPLASRKMHKGREGKSAKIFNRNSAFTALNESHLTILSALCVRGGRGGLCVRSFRARVAELKSRYPHSSSFQHYRQRNVLAMEWRTEFIPLPIIPLPPDGGRCVLTPASKCQEHSESAQQHGPGRRFRYRLKQKTRAREIELHVERRPAKIAGAKSR